MTPARLVLGLPGGLNQEFTLTKGSVTIGRAATNDIVLQDSTVSRNHARIERTQRGYEVVDLGSVNGVRVNGVAQQRAALSPGDVLALGDQTLQFDPAPPEPDLEATLMDAGGDPGATLFSAPLPVHLEESGVPRLAVHTASGTWEVPIDGDSLSIGRDLRSDVLLDFKAVSRQHAVVERSGDAFSLRDLKSSNGTWLGRQRIEHARLEDGDSFRIGPAHLVFKRGISQDGLDGGDLRGRAGSARRPVVVIPGFAGSNLWHGSEQVWPTLRMFGLPELLRLTQPLEARGIVDGVVMVPNLVRLDQYSLLTGYLTESLGYETGRDLLEFGYDFRQDIRDSARRLAAAIHQWKVSAPITLVAHSMGCLVARYYVERLGGAARVERIILIGGPHAGAPYAFASLLKGPGLLPLGMLNARLREMLATYPSWYQILPASRYVSDQQAHVDVLADERWVAGPNRSLLGQARQFRQELGEHSSVPAVCIFGYGIKTITGAVLDRDGAGGVRHADMVVTADGDGTIPETSAVLEGAEIHPVRQHHGSLYADNDVKMRLKIELTRRAAHAR